MIDYKAKQLILAKEFESLTKTGDKLQEDFKKITKRMNDLKAQHKLLQDFIDEEAKSLSPLREPNEQEKNEQGSTPGKGEGEKK
jgi:cell division protein FtsB